MAAVNEQLRSTVLSLDIIASHTVSLLFEIVPKFLLDFLDTNGALAVAQLLMNSTNYPRTGSLI